MLFTVVGAVAQTPEDKAEEDKQGVYINKGPMRDFADSAVNQIETGKVKIEAPFSVVVSGKLALKNASVVLTDTKIETVTQPENSDPAMVKLAQDGIIALSDAGWLGYLNNLKVTNVVIAVEQTDEIFSVDIRADQPSEARAKSVASSFGSLISVAATLAKNDEKKSDDHWMMLSAMSVTSEGSRFIISLQLPKPQFQELIKRKVSEFKAANSKVSGD